LNCCSIRSRAKRNQLSVLISYHNADIIFGCESHLNEHFLSSKILPKNYRIIRKDRTLGGGGVFIGYKSHLNVTKASTLMADTEAIWAKLLISSNKYVYLCSFYRPPSNDLCPITQFSESLLKLHQSEPNFPIIVLDGDFNFPGITWDDGLGQVNSNPAYGLPSFD